MSLKSEVWRSDSVAKASKVSPSVPPNGKSSHAAVQTRENLKCAFCSHCCGAAFIGGWKFEMIFDQPSCMRCNEHSNKVDFILDWCSCHSGGVLCSERVRRRKPQNVSGQSSVALSHRRKLFFGALHAAVQTCKNVCPLCGLARHGSAFISVFDSVADDRESLGEKTLFASYSAQWYPIFLQVMLPKFRKKDS